MSLFDSSSHPNEQRHGVMLPMLLGLLTLVLWFGFQTYQLIQERGAINTRKANQEKIYANAQKMRAQLDAIATGTARLAQQGNAHAQQVVTALRARGITINSNAAPAP